MSRRDPKPFSLIKRRRSLKLALALILQRISIRSLTFATSFLLLVLDGIELGFQFATKPMEVWDDDGGILGAVVGFFELIHRDELNPISGTMWRSVGWDMEIGGDVMVQKVYDRSAAFYDGAFTVTEKTTITIRRKSP